MPNLAKRDANPGSLDCESGILPLSYRATLSSGVFDGSSPSSSGIVLSSPTIFAATIVPIKALVNE